MLSALQASADFQLTLHRLIIPFRKLGDLAGEIDPGDGSWNQVRLDAYADRVLAQLGEQISNLESATLAKVVLGPLQIEAMNANLVGGDPYSGDCRIDQYAVWRPLSGATGHRTLVKGLWHIGASTHPGPGLAGLKAQRPAHCRLWRVRQGQHFAQCL